MLQLGHRRLLFMIKFLIFLILSRLRDLVDNAVKAMIY